MKKYKWLNKKLVGPLVAIIAVTLLLTSATLVFLSSEDADATGSIFNSKRQTSITLTTAVSSVETNKSIHADGLLKYWSGIAGALVNLKVTLPDGSSAIPSQGATTVTNNSGTFSMDYMATKPGKYVFTATYSGTGKYSPSSASIGITATQGSTTVTSQPVRWTWLQSPTGDVIGQSYLYSVKFEVQSTNGVWNGAMTTGITFTFTDPSGVVTILKTTTPSDTTGIGTVSFVPNVAGNWMVKCDWDHNNRIYAWDSSPVKSISVITSAPSVPIKQSTSLVLNGPTTSVQTGSAVRANGVLSGTSPIAGAALSFQVILPDGSVSYPTQGQSTTTDGSGMFAMDLVPTQPGTYKLVVTYGGSTQYDGSMVNLAFNAVAPAPTQTTTYDYIVSSNVVKTASGGTAYTGSSFTAALQWAVGQSGKVIYVPAGTYSVTASVYPKSGVTLMGDGNSASGTVFDFTTASKSSARICVNNVNNVVLKQFRVTGYGNVEVWANGLTASNILLQDITWYRTSSIQPGAFMTWVSNKGVIDGLKLIRCQAIETGCIGFALEGDRANVDTCRSEGGWVKNVYFEDCKALRCGLTTRFNDWVVGFDLAEGVNIQNIRLVRCEASDNWMTGYHFEKWPYVNNAVFEDCIANNNGAIRGAGYGFMYNLAEGHQVTLTNCIAVGNASGDTRYGGLPDA